MKTKFTHDELNTLDGHEFGVPMPEADLGPYELAPDSGGIPEGGNFHCAIILGNGTVIPIESWGYTEPGAGIPWDERELEEVVSRLIDLTGRASLEGNPDVEGVMASFWSLEGYEMKNRCIVKTTPPTTDNG